MQNSPFYPSYYNCTYVVQSVIQSVWLETYKIISIYNANPHTAHTDLPMFPSRDILLVSNMTRQSAQSNTMTRQQPRLAAHLPAEFGDSGPRQTGALEAEHAARQRHIQRVDEAEVDATPLVHHARLLQLQKNTHTVVRHHHIRSQIASKEP